MKVEVKPIDRERWHGKKGKEAFSQPIVVEVLFDAALGKYASGLTEEEEIEYGRKLGVDLTAFFNPEKDHPYWGSVASNVKLPNHTLILDDTKPAEYVKIKNLKASKFVANSLKEYEEGEFPFATHYIYDETEEMEQKSTRVEKRRKANNIVNEMTADDKASIVQILAGKTVRGMKPSFIDVALDDAIEKDIDEFLRVASLGKSEVYTRSQVLECIHRGILSKQGGSILYMGDVIGYDLEAAIQWFLDAKNQEQKVSILQKLTR